MSAAKEIKCKQLEPGNGATTSEESWSRTIPVTGLMWWPYLVLDLGMGWLNYQNSETG